MHAMVLEMTTHKRIDGQLAIGDRCSNGDRLIDFSATNHFTVSSTLDIIL